MEKPQKIFLGCLGLGLVFCGLGGWGIWRLSEFGRADAELDQAIVDAKAAGLPWLAKDLAQDPPVKPGENAAPITAKALELNRTDKSVGAALAGFTTAQTNWDEAAVADALKKLKPMIELARQAADKPRCDFQRDWDMGLWLIFPEYAVQKQMAKLLAAQAVSEARTGEDEKALADLKRTARLGTHAASDACFIGMLVGIACDAIALRGAEQTAELWRGDARRLAALKSALEDWAPEADLPRAFKGEAYMGISLARNFPGMRTVARLVAHPEESIAPKPGGIVRSGKPRTLFGRIVLCPYLQMWTRAYKEIHKTKDPTRAWDELQRMAETEEKAGISHFLNYTLGPVHAPAVRALLTMRARRRVTRGLVAVLEFRLRHERYPATLAEAGFKELDPFTDKPLLLAVAGDGCKIYSVGPDRKDDGAVRISELPKGSDKSKGWDEVASYPAYRKAKPNPISAHPR